MALSGIALVTGGAGFIGSHIARALIEAGVRVRIIDNLSTGYVENLNEIEADVDFVNGSINDVAALRRALQDVELVFHEAAIPSVPRSVKQPRETHDASVNGTFELLLAARDAGVRRVIYAASSSAYGDQLESPKRETMRPNPLTPYAAAKLVGEYYCQVFTHSYGLETVSLRYFNVFGPRQDPGSQYSGVISRFILALENGERPTIYGDGEQTRDFTYVANAVKANLLAAQAPNASGKVFNVANGKSTSINEVLGVLKRLTGRNELEAEYLPARAGDVRDSLADLEGAATVLGYQPKFSLEDGLDLTLEWWKTSRFSRTIKS
ncbi:MAG TPA: SDR family oxidoreductase [Pyrinomonadaceae bacterium]|jgi:UDP-glucose 4-epimerase|nr:SDR family oxidoreductase [Pyrinomonadaceae bacterium]